MKNNKMIVVIVILLFITCMALLIIKKQVKEISLNSTVNPTNETSSIKEGYVIFKNNKIYFIQNEDNINYQKILDKIKDKQHPSDSILTSHNPNLLQDIESGDKIKIWIKQVIESYPQKLIIEKYEQVKN
ncbi:DUF3221 domain-containing protein [Bacillus hominis]|uniref:DUF3221 domain-containing protein n=1 Tax=Bacillus hominis TaxID=2817478 RepID=A0ABT7RF89_9BACI|nr:DUF3221 domain-containing protein [Bacillus hominis]MDM5191206.1 DUF3221 domain-containing protein [Bacillus hominis]MDM5436456.1 DUF3221 domain-containing protein [Bacillus hominis]MDM5441605.1 DUF3221 domain-containing protein [Bacillus hominis]